MRRIASLLLLTAALLLAPVTAAHAALEPLRSVQWALDAVHLGKKPQSASGDGVVVAVLDSGVDLSHPEFAGRVIPGPDFISGGLVKGDPHGHGTHLAGLIAAQTANGHGIDGIAPSARILAIRVLNEHNQGSAYTLAQGIHAAVAARADVINVSLNWPQPAGTDTIAPYVDTALRRAAAAGIAVVVAAGNEGLGSCEKPALPDVTLCVGALDDRLRLAAFSSHGHGLGIVAPGTRLMSTFRSGYLPLSGTSQSAAVVSGIAALLAGQGLHGKAIIDRLQGSARDLGSPGYDPVFGFGLVDAERATTGAAEGALIPLVRVSAQSAKARTVRKKGLIVTCDAARAGSCSVKLRADGTTIAKGRARTDGGAPVTVRAKPTRAGKKLLRKGRPVRVAVTATVPGAPGARAVVRLR